MEFSRKVEEVFREVICILENSREVYVEKIIISEGFLKYVTLQFEPNSPNGSLYFYLYFTLLEKKRVRGIS